MLSIGGRFGFSAFCLAWGAGDSIRSPGFLVSALLALAQPWRRR